MGTLPAPDPVRHATRGAAEPQPEEARIRTLSVSIFALVALVASMAALRGRPEERDRGPSARPEPSPAAAKLDLEGIRAAGW